MKKRKIIGFMGLVSIFMLAALLYSQGTTGTTGSTAKTPAASKTAKTANPPLKTQPKTTAQPSSDPGNKKEDAPPGKENRWLPLIALLVGMIIGGGGFFAIYKYINRNKDAAKEERAKLEARETFENKKQADAARTAEDIYRAALKEELGFIYLPGSPVLDCPLVKLEDAFVTLSISESWAGEECGDPREKRPETGEERELSPGKVMNRAFQRYRLLLVIGDPGSGKTTLLKYYAVNCLEKASRRYLELELPPGVLPMYFPLRELQFTKTAGDIEEPVGLPENLSQWAEKHLLNISAEQFRTWLQKRKTLVLLDGLDEIGNKARRKQVCRWIKNMCSGMGNAFFVVTSRATGYRKLDGIELEVPHLRAEIRDFSPSQQGEFLKKWFQAVYCAELLPPDSKLSEPEWRQKQEKLAAQRSTTIIEFLGRKENRAVRELAAVPMMLQIMAIIWKKREFLPKTRAALYDAALNYLLEYRDQQKGIEPLLPAEEARLVLGPTALWMQEELQQDEAPKEQMHLTMQPLLNTLTGSPEARVFCEHLRDRAGVIADDDSRNYVFRHKSFREFLAGIRLRELFHKPKRINTLVNHFKEDWWEETLRFFMSRADDEIFDRFMRAFFKSKNSQQLDDHHQDLLRQLVLEAPQKRLDGLVEGLDSNALDKNQKKYVLDCLKTIGTPGAMEAIGAFIAKDRDDKTLLAYARDIAAEFTVKEAPGKIELVGRVGKESPGEPPAFFRNPFEDHVEYIRIPGGTYKFSVSQNMETVADFYLCKYPVTNKRYRRFISYLDGEEKELREKLPVDIFSQILREFSAAIDGYSDYLGKYPREWAGRFRSRYDEEKKFKGEDQPVVTVTWYAARAYCFWLSCLEAAITRGEKIKDIKTVPVIYRLPTEMEWEWAAGGEADGTVREYPWPKEKGKPTPSLANYNNNVGATTPVGRYPEGATPLGLMDMAGNAWEWMENLYKEGKQYRAFRGGSWNYVNGNLRCSARLCDPPGALWNDGGFRVLRPQSS